MRVFSVLVVLATAITANAAVITDQVGTPAPENATVTQQQTTLTGGFISTAITWTHEYDPISETILSATLQVDLIDADNGKLELFAGPNRGGVFLGEATGTDDGGPGPWRVLGGNPSVDNTLVLPGSVFADLADGTFQVFADDRSMSLWGSNRALLTIQTESSDAAPEPATIGVWLLLAGAFTMARRRQKKTTLENEQTRRM